MYLHLVGQNKTYEYPLVGYTKNSDLLIDDYANSKVVKGLKTISSGSFSSNSKMYSKEDLDDIIDRTYNVVNEKIKSVCNHDFSISPVKGKGLDACLYCEYKDICYVSFKDYRFIGGDDDEMDA